MHIKYNEAVTFEIEGQKIHPRKDCGKCYGRGVTGVYVKNRVPVRCTCVLKQVLKLKAEAIRNGTPKPPQAKAGDFSGELVTPPIADVLVGEGVKDAKE